MAKKRKMTFDQRHISEMAWLLYITEGYLANVRHAVLVNASTMRRADFALLTDALKGANTTARKIRAHLEKDNEPSRNRRRSHRVSASPERGRPRGVRL